MEDNAKTKRELERERLTRTILDEAGKKGVPTFWVPHFNGNTVEEAKAFMDEIADVLKTTAQKAKDEVLKTAQSPGGGITPETAKPSIYDGKSLAEVNRLAAERVRAAALK
jgi:hypothetical protein